MPKIVVPFGTETTPLLTEVGGKALSLIRTQQAGLPVPDGLALSVAFFEPWVTTVKATDAWKALLEDPSRERCEAVQALAANLTLTNEMRSTLESALTRVEGDVFAVRSSSPEEDLAGASFAGQYETFLGTTRGQLESIIARAFSSAFGHRVIAYKEKQGIDLSGTCISVIVQHQLTSDVSGVGFSLNPHNNCFDEAVINSSFGLGESIVSGQVTPDAYVVDKVNKQVLERTVGDKKIALHLRADGGTEEKAVEQPTAEALTNEQVLELTDLITQTEAHYGFPVDIEWAIEDGHLYLLQARPITTYVPVLPELMTEPGEPKKLYADIVVTTQGLEGSFSVLGGDLWARVMDKLKQGVHPVGEGGHLLNIAGRQYMLVHNINRNLGKAAARKAMQEAGDLNDEQAAAAAEIYRAPEKTALMTQSRRAAMRVLCTMIPAVSRALLRPRAVAETTGALSDELRASFLAIKNDRPFIDLARDAFEDFGVIIVQQGSALIASYIAHWRVKRTMKGTEGEDLADAVTMDVSTNPTSHMGHDMFALASFPAIQETKDGEAFAAAIRDRSYPPDVMAAWDSYFARYGHRGFREIDIATPRLADRLESFFSELKAINLGDNRFQDVAARKTAALEKIRAIAAQKGKAKKFDHQVDLIDKLHGYRELPKDLVVLLFAQLRAVALEIGDELVAAGRLDRREQVFDLHEDQLSRATKEADLDLRALIDDNLAPYATLAGVKRFPGLFDSRGKILQRKIEAGEGELDGQAMSRGKIVGKAKVLRSPYEKPLEPGEILVTVATEPAWTPVFSNAAGVVLEIGGALQHGAIIAREYGLPCVSGLAGVTDLVKDGDTLEVDGTNGIVRITARAEAGEAGVEPAAETDDPT